MENLTIKSLQYAIRVRHSKKFKHKPLYFYGNALAGETGELCNMIKKVSRADFGEVTGNDLELTQKTKHEMGLELADIIMYCAQIANDLNIDLATCTKLKFNEISERVNCDVKI